MGFAAKREKSKQSPQQILILFSVLLFTAHWKYFSFTQKYFIIFEVIFTTCLRLLRNTYSRIKYYNVVVHYTVQYNLKYNFTV